MQLQDEHITPVEELEDGSTVYEIGPDNEEQISNNDFYANLAEELSESSRNKLSTYLLEAIDEDMEARRDWLDSVNRVKHYLGFSLELTLRKNSKLGKNVIRI